MTKSLSTRASIEAVLAIILWGISFITIKIALQEVNPATLIVLRYTIGELMIGAFAARRGQLRGLKMKDLPDLVKLGLIGIALQQFLQVAGQSRSDASFTCTSNHATVFNLELMFTRASGSGIHPAKAHLNATHLHIARRYNGEWIPADGNLPFNLDGWISSGDGVYYNGYLTRGTVVLQAEEGIFEGVNLISR